MASLLRTNGQEPGQLRKLLEGFAVRAAPLTVLECRSSVQKDRAGTDHFLMHFNVGGKQICLLPLGDMLTAISG